MSTATINLHTLVRKHVMMYQPREGKCIMYWTEGVSSLARELNIGYDAANAIVRDCISSGDWRRR